MGRGKMYHRSDFPVPILWPHLFTMLGEHYKYVVFAKAPSLLKRILNTGAGKGSGGGPDASDLEKEASEELNNRGISATHAKNKGSTSKHAGFNHDSQPQEEDIHDASMMIL